jgi:CheY-like chemotaxis protein
MTRPRVLLVEDDASVRRFVTLALEELPIELVACDSVAPALAELARAPACLVLTDLMLPGEPGESLVRRLAEDAVLRGPARVAVFSAGLTPEVRGRLAGLGVWRLLSKPVSLAELEGCVREALATPAAAAAAIENPAPAEAATAVRRGHADLGDPGVHGCLAHRGLQGDRAAHADPAAPAAAHMPLAADAEPAAAAEVIATYFGGDGALYRAYRTSCRVQFAADARAGDAAAAAADWPALRRLAHALKTVLLTLGESAAGTQAATLEACCARAAAGDRSSEPAQAAARLWPALRGQLSRLADPGAAG